MFFVNLRNLYRHFGCRVHAWRRDGAHMQYQEGLSFPGDDMVLDYTLIEVSRL